MICFTDPYLLSEDDLVGQKKAYYEMICIIKITTIVKYPEDTKSFLNQLVNSAFLSHAYMHVVMPLFLTAAAPQLL